MASPSPSKKTLNHPADFFEPGATYRKTLFTDKSETGCKPMEQVCTATSAKKGWVQFDVPSVLVLPNHPENTVSRWKLSSACELILYTQPVDLRTKEPLEERIELVYVKVEPVKSFPPQTLNISLEL
jgi:hypothetical protein